MIKIPPVSNTKVNLSLYPDHHTFSNAIGDPGGRIFGFCGEFILLKDKNLGLKDMLVSWSGMMSLEKSLSLKSYIMKYCHQQSWILEENTEKYLSFVRDNYALTYTSFTNETHTIFHIILSMGKDNEKMYRRLYKNHKTNQ